MLIDGFSQPGYAGTPLIELSGSQAVPDGLTITGSDVTVRGLDRADEFAFGSGLAHVISRLAADRSTARSRIDTTTDDLLIALVHEGSRPGCPCSTLRARYSSRAMASRPPTRMA